MNSTLGSVVPLAMFDFLLKSLTLFFGKSNGVVEWRPDGGGGGPARSSGGRLSAPSQRRPADQDRQCQLQGKEQPSTASLRPSKSHQAIVPFDPLLWK